MIKNEDFVFVAEPFKPVKKIPMPDTGFNSEYTIYVDLDGVCADFQGRIKRLYGTDGKNLSDDDFWNLVNQHPKGMFRDLEPFEFYYDFLNYVNQIAIENDYEIYFLSALSPKNALSMEEQAQEKTDWLNQYVWHDGKGLDIPAIFTETAAKKQLFSGRKEILIDDNPKNINQWRDAGGIGIYHHNFNQSIQELDIVMDLWKDA